MSKIYRITDDEFSYLRDRIWSDEEAVEVGIDDVTLEELIVACDDEFENANYHGMVGATKRITDAVIGVAGEAAAKRTLWALVEHHGFMWGGD